MSARPFHVGFPQGTLEDPRERLARTRLPDEVEDAGWDYGVDRAYLKELTDYWRDEFDRRAQEEASAVLAEPGLFSNAAEARTLAIRRKLGG